MAKTNYINFEGLKNKDDILALLNVFLKIEKQNIFIVSMNCMEIRTFQYSN